MDLIKNKVIVVTGGTKGIGVVFVKFWHHREQSLFIIGRSEADNLTGMREIEVVGGIAK